MTPSIKDLAPEALQDWLVQEGQPRFRLKQIQDWLYAKWALDFDQMKNLPASLRERLAGRFRAFSLEALETQRAADGTEKFLFALADGESIETVLIRAPGRNTVCVSTQVGCAVGCVFCASGRGGLVRDLTPSEIVDQVVFACRQLGERVDNIVVMGMGEPLLNLGNLTRALEQIGDPGKLGIGARHVTISTSGIVPGIQQLADCGRQWNLALSLHATDDAKRARLIPDSRRYPLPDVLDACRYYREKSGRMVTLEYTVLQGKNDTPPDLEALAAIALDLRAKVNLIPYNPTGGGLRAPDREAVARFEAGLLQRGVQATVRREKGSDIMAACGQLRQQRSARQV